MATANYVEDAKHAVCRVLMGLPPDNGWKVEGLRLKHRRGWYYAVAECTLELPAGNIIVVLK